MIQLYVMSKCLYCHKDISNPKAKFCNDKERMKYKRKVEAEQKTRTFIVENPNKQKPEQTLISTIVKNRELVFTKETIEERIKIYKRNYEDSTFLANWVAHGYNSKLEALHSAIEAVDSSEAIKNLGL